MPVNAWRAPLRFVLAVIQRFREDRSAQTAGALTYTTLLYLVVPNRRVALRHAFAGALVAGVAFEFAKRGFALFITKVPTYAMIYGTFATMLFFLIWLYLSWLLVLVGATMSAMLPEHAERRIDEGEAR